VLSPLDGVGPAELNIPQLVQRVEQGEVRELIVATNFTMEGEATALYLRRLLQRPGLRLTRLAHGVPTGGNLEYLDESTLSGAMARRYEL